MRGSCSFAFEGVRFAIAREPFATHRGWSWSLAIRADGTTLAEWRGMNRLLLRVVAPSLLLSIPLLEAGCGGPGDGTAVGTSSSAASSSNNQTAFDYFVGRGLTDDQAAGIVGNLDQESSMDPSVYQYGGGPGRGIAQWSAGGRWDTDYHDNVVWYASTKGQSPFSLSLQLEFIWYELETFSGYGLGSLRRATNVTDATIVFQDDFEGCGTCDQSNRIAYAEAALAAFGSDKPSTPKPSPPTATARIGASVVPNRDGRLEAFGRGGDNALWHSWQDKPGGSWSGWYRLGGSFSGDPVVIQNEDGRLEAFAVATDGAVGHVWQTSAGGSWSGVSSLGGKVTAGLTVGQNKDGRLELFAQGTDAAVWHVWQHTAGGSWSGWSSLGGTITGSPAVGVNEDGRLEVFAHNTGDNVWHTWQSSPGGSWSGWSDLGGDITSDVAVGANHDGRIEIVGLAKDGSFSHAWQTTPNGSWSGWSSLGGALVGTPAVAANQDGRLEVFGRAPDDTVWHVWQETAGGRWSGWYGMGSTVEGISNPTAARNLDGRLELFVIAKDDALLHTWQETAGGAWSRGYSMGGKLY
jgi:hypothetical protein